MSQVTIFIHFVSISQVLLRLYYLIAEILAYSVEYLVPFLRRLTSVGILSLGGSVVC